MSYTSELDTDPITGRLARIFDSSGSALVALDICVEGNQIGKPSQREESGGLSWWRPERERPAVVTQKLTGSSQNPHGRGVDEFRFGQVHDNRAIELAENPGEHVDQIRHRSDIDFASRHNDSRRALDVKGHL